MATKSTASVKHINRRKVIQRLGETAKVSEFSELQNALDLSTRSLDAVMNWLMNNELAFEDFKKGKTVYRLSPSGRDIYNLLNAQD